ncbi:hypothetical protein QM332_31995, partial [Pseudomonas aeruginosa]|nr:hypothetical protein [Pseudomonas aeruginosa]
MMNNAEALLREWLASNAARLGPVPIEHLWAIRTRLLDREPMLRHRLSELRRRSSLRRWRSIGSRSSRRVRIAHRCSMGTGPRRAALLASHSRSRASALFIT